MHGWFEKDKHGEWANNVPTYVKYMEGVKTITDLRLRNYVSQGVFFATRHLAFGLRLLQTTKVYADATLRTQIAVDTFISYYYLHGFYQKQNTYVQLKDSKLYNCIKNLI